jgi:predicted RNase H-like nuclease
LILIARAVESGEKLTRSSVLLHCKDGVPMSENKKTQAGYLQRFELLSARMGKRTVIQLMSQIDADPLSSGVSRDDILDAMVCGYVARLDAAMLSMLPEGGVERNEKGDAMAICFPSPNV